MSPTSGQPPVADRTIEIRPGGVWVITLRGLLTATTIQAAKKRVLQAAAGEDVRAFLVDYRACAVALSDDDLDRVLIGEGPGAVATMPAAMVVRPELVDQFRAHAIRMAVHGHFRRVFLDFQPALGWAQQMAGRRQ